MEMEEPTMRLGDFLLESGKITKEQLDKALERADEKKIRLGDALVGLGYLSEEDLFYFLSSQLGIPRVELLHTYIDPQIRDIFPEKFARRHLIFPMYRVKDTLSLAMADPLDLKATDEVEQTTGLQLNIFVAAPSEILSAIERLYGEIKVEVHQEFEKFTGEKDSPEVPVASILSRIFHNAMDKDAGAIHIEPHQKNIRVRFRIDGVFHEVDAYPKRLLPSILTRLKVLAGMDLTDNTPLMKCGRFHIRLSSSRSPLDVRAVLFTSVMGEGMILELTRKKDVIRPLQELGIQSGQWQEVLSLLEPRHGIIMLTGPSGSGKTTTAYSIMNHLADRHKKIVSVEPYVNYPWGRVTQIELRQAEGKVHSILFLQPDILYLANLEGVGLFREAIRAAASGRLVLISGFARDATSAHFQFLNQGVNRYELADVWKGSINQRRIRLNCNRCQEVYSPESDLFPEFLGDDARPEAYYRGVGCEHCFYTGYRGSTAIFEVYTVTDERGERIRQGDFSSVLRENAISGGMKTLFDSGMELVNGGLTTIEELNRVLA